MKNQKNKGKNMAKPKSARSTKSTNKSKSSLKEQLFRRKYSKHVLVALVFAAIGSAFLLASYAAVPTGSIVNKQSGECLENFFGRQLNTNFISTYPCQSGNQSQQWTMASDSSIRTAQNYCLDVVYASKTAGTRVWLWQCNGSVAQQWQVQSNGTIKNPNSGLCIEATATDTFLGGPNIIVNTCDGANTRQVWTVPSALVPIPTPSPTNPPSVTTPSGSVDVKSACKNSTTTVNGTTARSGYPNDHNTGPEAGGINEDKLPSSGRAGKWSITQDGYVVNSVYHNGTIEVNANNVVIKNSVICGTGALIIRNNGQNLTIENSIIRGESGTSTGAESGEPCAAGVGYGNYTMRRSELVGCADGAKLANKVAIYDSFFHDNYRKEGVTHTDIIQKNDLTPLNSFIYEGNASYGKVCTSNRHFQIEGRADQPAMSLLRIKNNFFYGLKGINFLDLTTTSGEFSGNVFAGSATQGPMSSPLFAGGMTGIRVFDNKYESGQPANSNYASTYNCIGG